MGQGIEVSAKNTDTGAEAKVTYDFGDNLQESVSLYGENVVHEMFVSQAKVRLQAGLRSCMDTGKDPVEFAANWKPGVKAPSISADPFAVAKAAFAKMDDEKKAEFLRSLK